MFKKEDIIKALEKAELSNVEVIQEEEGMALVRFYYDFDETEMAAAQSFADAEEIDADLDNGMEIEDVEDEEDITADDILDAIEDEALENEVVEGDDFDDDDDDDDLCYDEDDEYYDSPKLRYLSEIAIDQVGESLEEIRDDFDIEIQYVGYDLEEADFGSYEFVALIFDKDKALNIEDLLDELDM